MVYVNVYFFDDFFVVEGIDEVFWWGEEYLVGDGVGVYVVFVFSVRGDV